MLIIDSDEYPRIPEGWKIRHHLKLGKVEFNPKKIELYLPVAQQGSGGIPGPALFGELERMPALNATFLEKLCTQPELIPAQWDRKDVFFWGTILMSSNGDEYVRYLCRLSNGWHPKLCWIKEAFFRSNRPAAIRIL